MTAGRKYALLFGTFVVCCFVASVIPERQPAPTIEQAVAHEQTVEGKRDVAKIDTALKAATLSAVERRAIYRAIRDSALRDLKNTELTKRAFAAADTAIIHDTITIQLAGIAIEKRDTVIVRQDREIALKPIPIPRLRTTVAAYYEPIAARYSGSADASFRVIGNWQLAARIVAPIGQQPLLMIGVARTF